MKIDKKFMLDVDVVTAARQRIKNIFSNGLEVIFSISGGKDSICVHDLLVKMIQAGEIDKSKLRVRFIDEEAIYPCVEKSVMRLRRDWLLLGVPFDWYAMEFKHYNCLNMLSQDESFICFDGLKKDVWVRQPPSFAIRTHPALKPGKDSYQEWSNRVNRGKLMITGVRATESIQRLKNLATGSIETTGKAYPIYDWTDKDVWRYLSENNLEIPDAYLYMYQCGVPLNRLRISQFFSIDTVGSLVKMCEYYPRLFDKICRREPNAYMAMLYYDTELFRRAKRKKSTDTETVDYRAQLLDFFSHPEKIRVAGARRLLRNFKRVYLATGAFWTEKEYREAYQILTAGDPKQRSIRALWQHGAELKQGVRR